MGNAKEAMRAAILPLLLVASGLGVASVTPGQESEATELGEANGAQYWMPGPFQESAKLRQQFVEAMKAEQLDPTKDYMTEDAFVNYFEKKYGGMNENDTTKAAYKLFLRKIFSAGQKTQLPEV